MKILFDNESQYANCKSLWGFSLYLEKYSLLFDTGSNGRVLLKNMKQLNVDIEKIKYLFITHSHWDHIGGIDSILELNQNLTLFVPSSLSKRLIVDLKTLTKKVIICDEKPKKLFSNIYTTGILGSDMPEQSLIIDEKHPKVITGCGHYGIEKITAISKKVLKKDIHTVIGGFHLLEKNEKEILESINSLKKQNVKKVLPTHCTGNKAIELYKKEFRDHFIQGGIGCVIPSL